MKYFSLLSVIGHFILTNEQIKIKLFLIIYYSTCYPYFSLNSKHPISAQINGTFFILIPRMIWSLIFNLAESSTYSNKRNIFAGDSSTRIARGEIWRRIFPGSTGNPRYARLLLAKGPRAAKTVAGDAVSKAQLLVSLHFWIPGARPRAAVRVAATWPGPFLFLFRARWVCAYVEAVSNLVRLDLQFCNP